MPTNPSPSYFFPAEWHTQDGIQLTWPHTETDWKPYLDDITACFLLMAKEITKRERLIVVTPHLEETAQLLTRHLSPKALSKVSIYVCPTNDTWARDHGALTLLPRQEAAACLPCQDVKKNALLLDYKFNGWGEKFTWQKDNAITKSLYEQNAFRGKRIDRGDFVLEGGSIESDGKGTILTTSCCLLAPHRNQPLNKQEITEILKRDFCAERVLWLEHGHLAGDDTDGHIDTLARFAPDDTIVYEKCDDPADEHTADLNAMEEELAQMRTLSGHHYRLVPLPLPHPIYDEGERLPATYANFVIMNGAVLMPTYNQPDNDMKAQEILAQVFPGYDIVGIDATTVIRQHGSLHCLTMQYPQGALNTPAE